jgi:hypothetical protein
MKREQLFSNPAVVMGIILLAGSALAFLVNPLLAAAIALFYILLMVPPNQRQGRYLIYWINIQ